LPRDEGKEEEEGQDAETSDSENCFFFIGLQKVKKTWKKNVAAFSRSLQTADWSKFR